MRQLFQSQCQYHSHPTLLGLLCTTVACTFNLNIKNYWYNATFNFMEHDSAAALRIAKTHNKIVQFMEDFYNIICGSNAT